MTHRVPYKGYIIEAHPHQLADGGRWSLDVTIERHEADQVTERPFSAANLFDIEEEAVQHCINFGRQIIDGHVPGCTAP